VAAFLRDVGTLLRRLFGRDDMATSVLEARDAAASMSLRPFADYRDPFASGLAQRSSLEHLVTYSFQALEAWAQEHGCGRQAEQTPLEFAEQVHRRAPQVGSMARHLAVLYSQVAYSTDPLPAKARAYLQQLWTTLSDV
jgi:hypothetical protein